jgi:hypothetical protein
MKHRFWLSSLKRMASLRRRLSNCVALHGVRDCEIDFGCWYRFAISWFEQNGVAPDKIGVGRSGSKFSELRPFARESKRLIKSGFADVSSLELKASIPDADSVMQGWRLSASIARVPCYALLCADDDIRGFDKNLITSEVREIAKSFKICYGYAYRRPFKFGPDVYQLGMVTEGMSKPEVERASKWAHALLSTAQENDLICSYLREVCSLNFLSPKQLALIVDGQTLQAWIEASSERGRLERFIDGLWLWDVPTDSVPMLQRYLGERRLLISYGDYHTPSAGPDGENYV